MRTALVVAGLLAAGLVAAIDGQAVDCVTNKRCGKDEKPPACCQPPPCEIYETIRWARAVRRMFGGDRTASALTLTGGNQGRAIQLLKTESKNEGAEIRSQSKCKGGKPYYVPKWRVTESCDMRAGNPGSDMLVVDAKTLLMNFDACSEFLEAEYERMYEHKATCLNGGTKGSLDAYARMVRNAQSKYIDKMMGRLQQYWSACSSVVAEANRRELEAIGVPTDDLVELTVDAVKQLQRRSRPGRKPAPAKKLEPTAVPGR